MLKDITIGQYFPGHSPIHRLDPRIKIVLTFAYIIMLFSTGGFIALGLCVVFVALCYALSRIPFVMIVRSLRPIVPIVVFTAVLNMLFVEGETVFRWWVINITDQGISTAIFMTVRVICLIGGTSLLSYTTSPIALTDGIERLMSPLKRLGLPVHELAMMMTIALRFIPTLIEETEKIMSAQKARGADMESGGLMQRAKALIPVLIPLFVSAFRRAEELALAMECRCYRGGEGRTRMKQLHIGALDVIACGMVGLAFGGVVYINILGLY